MFSYILRCIVFATFCTLAICDTQGLYNLQQIQSQHPPNYQNSNGLGYDEPLHSSALAQPRFGMDSALTMWNPLSYLNFEALLQPAITALGFIAGLLGIFQITDWLFATMGLGKATKVKPTEEKDKTEETNEVERRKRMISAEETSNVLGAIETFERALELVPVPLPKPSGIVPKLQVLL